MVSDFAIDSVTLQRVTKVNDLVGVQFNSTLTFNDHIYKIAILKK